MDNADTYRSTDDDPKVAGTRDRLISHFSNNSQIL